MLLFVKIFHELDSQQLSLSKKVHDHIFPVLDFTLSLFTTMLDHRFHIGS